MFGKIRVFRRFIVTQITYVKMPATFWLLFIIQIIHLLSIEKKFLNLLILIKKFIVTKKIISKSKTKHYALNGKIPKFSQSLSGKSENGQIYLSKMKNFTFKYKNKKIQARLT
jgi:hypothetical protein